MVSLPHDPLPRVPVPARGHWSRVASTTDIVWYFRVERRDAAGAAILACAGRISHKTSPAFENALADAAASPAPAVILDLSGVDYISSPGLRALQAVSTNLTVEGRTLIVCGLTDAVAMAFSLGGLTDTLRIETSREGTLAALAAPPDPPAA